MICIGKTKCTSEKGLSLEWNVFPVGNQYRFLFAKPSKYRPPFSKVADASRIVFKDISSSSPFLSTKQRAIKIKEKDRPVSIIK